MYKVNVADKFTKEGTFKKKKSEKGGEESKQGKVLKLIKDDPNSSESEGEKKDKAEA